MPTFGFGNDGRPLLPIPSRSMTYRRVFGTLESARKD
jgi:hypothetical protein